MSDVASLTSAFAKFNSILEKTAKSHVKLKGFSDISEYIPTGNYMLNALLSGSLFGGYPNTRSVAIAGDPGTGKTFLCMNGVREAQHMGYVVFYVDTEGALDTTDFDKFGIDRDLLKYVRLGTITEVKLFMNDLIKTAEDSPGLKIMVVIDSLSQLETDKEQSDLDKGKSAGDMGLRAKEFRAAFRSFTLDLSNLKIPHIFTSHISASMDQYKPDSMNGGKGPEYSSSIVLMLNKGALKDEKTNEKTGVICRASTHKNRLAKPGKIEMHISFLKGMNPFVGLHLLPFSWTNCGVGRGNKFTEKEYSKLKPAEQTQCVSFEVGGEKFYFMERATARNYVLRHSGELVPIKAIFSANVWTPEVLKELDENLVKPSYRYSTAKDVLDAEADDLDEFSDDDDQE
jgi:RecA/RadA recombinase